MKKNSWFGVVALGVILGLVIGFVAVLPRASASTKYVENDSTDESDKVVIDVNMTLDLEPAERTESTSPTEEIEIETSHTTPATTENASETSENTHPNTSNVEKTGCDHLWKAEYTPATHTEKGSLTHDCLKCGASRLIETYPMLEN